MYKIMYHIVQDYANIELDSELIQPIVNEQFLKGDN